MTASAPSLPPQVLFAYWNQVCQSGDALEEVLIKFVAMILRSASLKMACAEVTADFQGRSRRGQNRRRRIDLALARSLLEDGRELREIAALMNVAERVLARALATGKPKTKAKVKNGSRAKTRAA